MPDINSFPQADGDSRCVTSCDVHRGTPATTFISAGGFNGYRCDLPGCADACIATYRANPLLSFVRFTRKAAA